LPLKTIAFAPDKVLVPVLLLFTQIVMRLPISLYAISASDICRFRRIIQRRSVFQNHFNTKVQIST